MTRKRYIKKARYLLWRLHQLPCNQGTKHKDCYWSAWKKLTPTPRVLGCSYDEAWAEVREAIRTIEGLEDIE